MRHLNRRKDGASRYIRHSVLGIYSRGGSRSLRSLGSDLTPHNIVAQKDNIRLPPTPQLLRPRIPLQNRLLPLHPKYRRLRQSLRPHLLPYLLPLRVHSPDDLLRLLPLPINPPNLFLNRRPSHINLQTVQTSRMFLPHNRPPRAPQPQR